MRISGDYLSEFGDTKINSMEFNKLYMKMYLQKEINNDYEI